VSRTSRASRRGGLTMLEVLVSATILAALALALMTAMVPLSTASSDQGATLDMDRVATKVLTALRRELRQSGYDGTAAKFGRSPPPLGVFPVGDTALLATPQSQLSFQPRRDESSWGTTVVWLHDPATRTVKRTHPGVEPTAEDLAADTDQDPSTNKQMPVADHVDALTFQVLDPAGGDPLCVVTIELSRRTNRGVELRRTFVEKIEMMNR
jgi:hypothetical protein